MPGKLIMGKGTALKKGYNEADVKMMVNFLVFTVPDHILLLY